MTQRAAAAATTTATTARGAPIATTACSVPRCHPIPHHYANNNTQSAYILARTFRTQYAWRTQYYGRRVALSSVHPPEHSVRATPFTSVEHPIEVC